MAGKSNVVVSPEMDEGRRRAIEAAGGVSQLAAGIGVHRTAVFRWHKVPAEWCAKIESLYGVPRAVLRPDLFGDEVAAKRATPSVPRVGLDEVRDPNFTGGLSVSEYLKRIREGSL